MTKNNPELTPALCTLLAPYKSQNMEDDAVWRTWAKTDSGATYLRILDRRAHDISLRVTFEQAKTVIRPILDPVGFNETPSRGPVYMRHWFNQQPLGYGKSAEALRRYVDLSEKKPDYWEAVCLIAARLLRENTPLGEDLRLWLADVMDGERKQPKRKPGKRPYANVGRDIHVRAAITVLEGLGLRPTRNAESAQRESACDAVAEVLAEFRQALSYEAIAKVWNDRSTKRTPDTD